MTKQEYYDLLVKSSYDGTFPSMEIGVGAATCRYRSLDGLHKCAGGLLIPDDVYMSSFEGMPIDVLTVLRPYIPEGLNLMNLRYIQLAHDSVALNACNPTPNTWDAGAFIRKINALSCFQDVVLHEEVMK